MTNGTAGWRVLCAATIAVIFAAGPAYAASPTIKILTLDWTSQIVVSHIAGELLSAQKYSVSYLSEAADSQWFLLSSGQADLQIEVWEGSMAKEMSGLSRRGLIVDAGDHEAVTREEWWYPAYVKAQCPGLPDWRALRKCAPLFATAGGTRGTYYSGPWEKPDRARIRALGLPFDVVQLKDGDELRSVLEEAVAQQRPIVLFNWTPNWVESIYEGEFVEFPVYAQACETEPEWGINEQLTWDCGNPKDGWLKKAVSRRFPTIWPCAYALIQRISLSNADISQAAALVDVRGFSHQDAARHWLAENEPKWRAWLQDAGCVAEGSG